MSESSTPVLRVATYNVHGCVGMDGQRSESRIADVIAGMSADVVGLQELDSGRKRSAAVDQAAVIAQQLGWRHCFHPAMRHGDEQYGDAIISRYPLTLKRAIELPGTGTWYCREKRVAIWVDVESNFGAVHIINSHFGLGGAERVLQAELVLGPEVLGSLAADVPAVVLGDFNSVRSSRSYRMLARQLRDVRSLVRPDGAFRTFPTRFPALAVDHIFVTGALHATALEVHRTPVARVASDHYPLVANLVAAGAVTS
jgi:endonuclease/exonuclease/phosphatase family metal-dependent hydrolase